MAKTTYSDRIGVSECQAKYDEALKLIGKQDENGRTISICYFSWSGLQMAPLVLRLIFFVFLLSLVVIHHPFALFISPHSTLGFLAELELFSWGTWIPSILIYTIYFAVSLLQSSIYTGLPGSEIHFARHKKIIKTVKAGQYSLIFDWRVKPYAVVSTKPIALEMPSVEGNTRDNISLTFRGALILRVNDTYKLLVEGGLTKFNEQLKRSYESILKDLMISIEAKDFNRFLIEEVQTSQIRKEDVSKKLEQLGKTDLTIEFLSELTEIDEVDVSTFNLNESSNPQRRKVLEGLKQLASNYGVEIIDHLPLGNTTNEDYLHSLALPLANSITRLEQSTDTLKEITEEEISEEILANVAHKQIGVLEIQKIIKEIESITSTLRDQDNETMVVHAKALAMENTLQTILAPQLSAIDSLIAQVQAKVIDTAGLERYMSEVEGLLDWIEKEMSNLFPSVEHMVLDTLNQETLLPNVDIIESMLESTGTAKAFNALRAQAESNTDHSEIETEIKSLENRSEKIQVEQAMQSIQNSLNKITSDSGISTEEYSPENVSFKIDDITEKADIDLVEST